MEFWVCVRCDVLYEYVVVSGLWKRTAKNDYCLVTRVGLFESAQQYGV